jgi:hypothetical protein
VAESVVEGKTGAFFDEPTVNALAVGLSSLDSASFKPEDCREQAMNFSEDIFKKKITSFIESKIRNSRIDD